MVNPEVAARWRFGWLYEVVLLQFLLTEPESTRREFASFLESTGKFALRMVREPCNRSESPDRTLRCCSSRTD